MRRNRWGSNRFIVYAEGVPEHSPGLAAQPPTLGYLLATHDVPRRGSGDRRHLFPQVLLFKSDFVTFQEQPQFFLKRQSVMVCFLPKDV